jgi:hypothetical protein
VCSRQSCGVWPMRKDKRVRILSGKRVLMSAFLSGLLNAALFAASIGSAHEEEDTFIQGLIRIIGFPAGLIVHGVGAEGHEALQAVLLMGFSFGFYWALIWAVWTAVHHWRRTSESHL